MQKEEILLLSESYPYADTECCKVKSHAHSFFNEMAEKCAKTGRLSDAEPLFSGPNNAILY